MHKKMIIALIMLLAGGVAWFSYDAWTTVKPHEVAMTLTGPSRLARGEVAVYGVTIANRSQRNGRHWQVQFTMPSGLTLLTPLSTNQLANLNVAADTTGQTALAVKAAQAGDWVVEAQLLVAGQSWQRHRLTVTVLPPNDEKQPLPAASWWQQCQFEYHGQPLLDMSSDFWLKLSVAEQQAYAQAYQIWYGRTYNHPLEKEVSVAGTSFILRLIPPARLWIGSPENEAGRLKDEPRYRVVLPEPFYIGKYEVTQGQWQTVMGKNPANFQGSGLLSPVEQVSWTDCQEFCQKTGLQLATEAQWEHACRAGVTTAYWFGDDANQLGSYAWFDINAGGFSHSVGQKPGNTWGCYDLHGNVWEWCQDWKGDYPTVATVAPQGPDAGTTRVRRGCSWKRGAALCRSASRHGLPIERRTDCMGLRVCANVR